MTTSSTLALTGWALAALSTAVLTTIGIAQADALRDKWCSNVHIRFFVGGAQGDTFATIVYNGAAQAAQDLGAKVDYIYSSWTPEIMIQQLRDAIAAKPDGIAMMGHPGNAAIMPLAEQASQAGIKMIYQNVPADDVTARFGGTYIGAQQNSQGKALGIEAIRRFGLKPGDVALVMAGWGQQERVQRELGTVQAFEAIGMKVVKLDSPLGSAGDPDRATPIVTAGINANPTTRLIAYPGGQFLGNAATYMKAAGKKAGEIINIGFDASPQVIEGLKDGWVQLTSDQQPFQQGYLPILSLCEQVVYGLGGINVDTGGGFVTPDNYKTVADLAAQGLR